MEQSSEYEIICNVLEVHGIPFHVFTDGQALETYRQEHPNTDKVVETYLVKGYKITAYLFDPNGSLLSKLESE